MKNTFGSALTLTLFGESFCLFLHKLLGLRRRKKSGGKIVKRLLL